MIPTIPIESAVKLPRSISRLWWAIAVASCLSAIFIMPNRLIAHVPQYAGQFGAEILAGLRLLRASLFGVSLLSVMSALFWKQPTQALSVDLFRGVEKNRWGYRLILLLVVVTALVRLPNMNASFWWDELITLVRTVRRGPAIIMFWADGANNHVLNSALIYLTRLIAGEGAFWVRLPAFILGTILSPISFILLRKLFGTPVALTVAAQLAIAPSCWVVSTEARGYSGAMLFSFLSCTIFARLLSRPSRAVSILYIACITIAAGFLPISLLIPVAHAIAAIVVAMRRGPKLGSVPMRAALHDALFTCLWAEAVSLVMFGFTFAQVITYSQHGAERDHALLGLPLLNDLAEYFGGAYWLAGIFLLSLSAFGYARSSVSFSAKAAFAAPLLVGLVWLLVPGARFSSRMFYFCTPLIAVGIALAVGDALLRRRHLLGKVALILVMGFWIASVSSIYARFVRFKNPDLRQLASRLPKDGVVLLGQQADMNVFYFPNAISVKSDDPARLNPAVQNAQYVVQGYLDPACIDSQLFAGSFTLVDVLQSWDETLVSYRVYKRTSALAP